MLIIGLCGKMGSGKDYIATNYIFPYLKQNCFNAFHSSFADQIKVNVIVKNEIPFSDVFVEKTDKTRLLLQKEGTENGRDVLGKRVWINYFDAWTQVFANRGIDVVVATDVRFKNEFDYVKQRGIVIKVEAPKRNQARLLSESLGDSLLYEKIGNHSSECDLDDIDASEFDIIIRNDIEDAVDEAFIHQQLSKLMKRYS